MLILSLSIVLLTGLGISSAEIGSYYIALTLSIVIITLGLSMSYMILPATHAAKSDLSVISQRLGLSFTAPLVSALLVQPDYLLGIMGPAYSSSGFLLLPLAWSVLPSLITMNAISKFNTSNDQRKILIVGALEICLFLLSFYILVPYIGIVGTGYSTFFAFVASTAASLLWSERVVTKYVLVAIGAVGVSWMIGNILNILLEIHPLLIIIISMVISASIIVGLKNVRRTELFEITRNVFQSRHKMTQILRNNLGNVPPNSWKIPIRSSGTESNSHRSIYFQFAFFS